MTVHAIIPDCQVKDGVDLSYLTWVGKYLAEKKPDVIVQIGDFADMPSLSSYDVGKIPINLLVITGLDRAILVEVAMPRSKNRE